jgi:toxin secretion/phage lysis holin
MICTGFGIVSATVSAALGGWDTALMALVVFMAVDYISGSLVALVFHNSRKTESGCYNSGYGFKGLCKKCLMLLFVAVAVQADRILEINYLRDAVCLAFCANEILSIVENLGLAVIPLPDAVRKALEQLRDKAK